jgi:mannose-6-phosphate isomerase-like protein (cupin superfamily)
MITDRPWGTYEVLTASETHQVKRIVVHPGKRLSYQTHEQRSEYWVIVSGTGTVTLDDIQSMALGGDAFIIEQGIAHRIANTGEEDLVFIETQLGLYFGEDDIVRLEDDFGRA